MTTFESRRAAEDAKGSVASRMTPDSRHELALQKYLAATTYLTYEAPEGAPPLPRKLRDVDASADLIVAGVDGSTCARDAVTWAASEAQRRGGSLLLIYAYVLPPVGYSSTNPYPPNTVNDLRAEGCAVLADTESELQRAYPDLRISTRMVYGDPAKVLAKASAGAAVTVVGAHGRSRVSMALGSVAGHLAHSNPAPVAVIRAGTLGASGPVVVGVDGSASSLAALSFAFRTAAVRGASLVAVQCWQTPVVDGLSIPPDPRVPEALDVLRRRVRLEEFLAHHLADYPQVPAEPVVLEERPTPALLRYSGTAQLVVVGSRGNHRLTELMLGSTGSALIARSAAPVVVVQSAS